MLNYLTVLEYTKTIIHLSGGGQWWIFTSPLRRPQNVSPTSHLHL